ncbi:MAG: HAD-IC family P-type ATPase [Eubacterium sp.]|jgi:cation-transporting ATPase E|nr:HAD-IC family P-type ATPase [Eubacterium sp.]
MDLDLGLRHFEVEQRIKSGLTNDSSVPKSKTVWQIIRDNTFTFFNLLNVLLALLVIIYGESRNALFMVIILINTTMGIAQEVRAKRVIDKLSLISAPKARVIRDGIARDIAVNDIVLGDLTVLSAGMQICADAAVLSGECEVNESIITGESDHVNKKRGDELLSGSFVVSGSVMAQVIRVGDKSFAAKITNGVKYHKRPKSQIMSSMNKLIKIIALCIVPIGLILMYKSIFMLGEETSDAISSTVAALIGMIPEGLMLLISVVFSISAVRLAGHKALVQDMHCIETLARVDTLCLDKTGTITTGKMSVNEVIHLERETEKATLKKAMTNVMAALPDENPTAFCLREYFSEEKPDEGWIPTQIVPFSSSRKWSGVCFGGKGSYIIGAPEFIFQHESGGLPSEIAKIINSCAVSGGRIIMLAGSYLPLDGKNLPQAIKPLALFVISETIRKEAHETLKYFREQGVELKIISGDNPLTVSGIAGRAGLPDFGSNIDMSDIDTAMIPEIAEKYTVFGRVSPDQKLEIIKALKKKGKTVGMTGDGVNDVLALKEADCSIAMQSGSDAAKNISNLVLLDSNFASLPKAVSEGRRSINNIERSAVLFLTKTVYAAIIAIFFVFINSPFPFIPIQLTVINACFIGAPSFFLALEPNKNRQTGSFMLNVLKRAVPYGLCSVICVAAVTVFGGIMNLSYEEIRTVSTYIFGASCFAILCRLCVPFKPFKAIMAASLGITFAFAMIILRDFIGHDLFTTDMTALTFALGIIILPLIIFLPNVSERIIRLLKQKNKINL